MLCYVMLCRWLFVLFVSVNWNLGMENGRWRKREGVCLLFKGGNECYAKGVG